MSQTHSSAGEGADTPAGTETSWKIVAGVLAALTLFRLVVGAYVPLVPDDAYTWLWSLGPSWGYYTHPPMIAWWVWASTKLFGDTVFAVRLPSVLSVLVTSLAVIATARELFGRGKLGLRAALWFNAMLLVGVGAIFASPDEPSVVFWALATWALAALRRTGNPKLWLLVGLLAGLGGLSKYTDFFLGIGIVLWLVVDRDARRWLLNPWLWAGGAVAFLVFLPNLLWNADNGWLTFTKQFGRIDSGGLALGNVPDFIGGFFGLLNPLVAIFAAIGVVRAFRPGKESDGARFLVLLGAPLIVYMCVHSLHARVEGNWLAPLYPSVAILAVFGAVGAGAGLPAEAARGCRHAGRHRHFIDRADLGGADAFRAAADPVHGRPPGWLGATRQRGPASASQGGRRLGGGLQLPRRG